MSPRMSRRRMLGATLAAAIGGPAAAVDIRRAAVDPAYRIRNAGIRHSGSRWCSSTSTRATRRTP